MTSSASRPTTDEGIRTASPRSVLRLFLGLCFVTAFLALAHHSHLQAARIYTEAEGSVHWSWVPDGATLRPFAMGQQTTLADVLWLRMVHYVGHDAAAEAKWPQLYEWVDSITDLDPLFGYAYEAGGIVLASAGRIDESNRIFDKGMAAVPERWQLPFFAAHNRWYSEHDLMGGAQLLLRAAKIPGSPRYLPGLVARLTEGADQLEVARQWLAASLSQDLPPTARKEFERRLGEIYMEQDLRSIEAALSRYHSQVGVFPISLERLVEEGYLPEVPVAPNGSPYHYDPIAGTVSSPLLERRIRFTRPADTPSLQAKER